MTTFTLQEAYQQWLGIAPHELPPHHYQLLGIRAMESDTSAILAAYGQRTAQVSAHLQGSQTEIARQLLGELAAAQACLLNAQAKGEYDRTLSVRMVEPASNLPTVSATTSFGPVKRPAPRERIDYTPTQAGIAAAPVGAAKLATAPDDMTAPSEVAQADATPIAGNSQLYREPAKPATALPWLIGGVCAGLLGVCVLGLILFARPRDRNTAELQSKYAAGGQRADEVRSEQRGRKEQPTRLVHSSGSQAGSNTNVVDDLRWDKEPASAASSHELLSGKGPTDSTGTDSEVESAGTVTPIETTPIETTPVVADPFASLPTAIPLPRRRGANVDAPSGPIVLTRIDVDKSTPVSLKLASSQLVDGANRYELLSRPAGESEEGAAQLWDVQYTSTDGQSKIVGTYELADGELSFAWSPDAEEGELAQLQNQPLQISAGDFSTTLPQRTADEVPAMVVKVDSGAMISTPNIDAPPENADVFLAFEELGSDFPQHQWEPENTIALGKETNLLFGSPTDTYQLALRITAESVGPNKVRIEARPMFREGDTQKWDYFRPKAAAQTLANLQTQESLIDAQMEQLRRRFRRNPDALQQASAVLSQQAASLQGRIANLKRINADCQAMQEKAKLHFRLYAQNGSEEIDLVRTAKDESTDAESPQRETDPNIGPPIEEGAAITSDEAPISE